MRYCGLVPIAIKIKAMGVQALSFKLWILWCPECGGSSELVANPVMRWMKVKMYCRWCKKLVWFRCPIDGGIKLW